MKTVLIVEDSPYYFERAEKVAKQAGLEVYLAHDGRTGVEMYEDYKPDFVIMDICMPEMDGLEATKTITQKYPEAKIVICSSVGYVPIYKKQALANGAVEFLPKEFDLRDLKLVIEYLNMINK